MSRKKRQQKAIEKKQARAAAQVVNKAKTPGRRKKAPSVPHGRIFISSTFNNTIITVTDLQDNAVAQSSTGRVGFKGTKKSTPFAANQTAKSVIDKFEAMG